MSTQVETRAAIPAGTWHADAVHSEIGFGVEYMAGTFHGTFSSFAVSLEDGALTGTADVESIEVKDPNLETHLQSPEFFDAERHPRLAFASQAIERSGDGVLIRGELTMKGHTEPVEIHGVVSGPITDPWGKERLGLRLEAVVDRTRFGLDWNNLLPSGEPALADRVTLTADLQLVRAA